MPLALITGGAKRIGASLAQALAKAGFDIALHVNTSAAEGEKLAVLLRKSGVRAEVFTLDLSQTDQIETMMGSIEQSMGKIDVLINNASAFSYDKPAEFDYQLAEKLMRINLFAPVELTRCLANHGSAEALVVNMLDNKVYALNPDFFSYTLTKSALQSATQMMAMGFARKIRVNAIAPGVTLISGDQSADNFDKSWRKSLSGVGATPDDIANTVLHIWNTKSINGETIVLDGGQRHMALERDVAFVVETDT